MNIALSAIGNINQIRVMLGCEIMVDDSTCSVTLAGVKGSKVSHVKVSYDQGKDLFNLLFLKINFSKYTIKEVAKIDGVFAGQVRPLISEKLRLSLSL